MTFRHFLAPAALLALGACVYNPQMQGGQYWQRVSVSDAVYQQGPKAQQMLDRDIGRCVVELREEESMGAIKDAIPTDPEGRVLDPDEKKAASIDTPDHDGHLLAEQSDYHDFDGCMKAKGWERVQWVPFDVAKQAQATYYKANVNYGYDPKAASVDNTTENAKYRKFND